MEEIIIDGVNVAGCKFFIEDYQRANNIEGRYEHCKNVCELNGDNYFYCEMNKDCYYKQLKRLEQENAELKKYEYYYLDKFIDLKQALEKIRGICEYCENEEHKGCAECKYDCESFASLIRNKINEVLGNE